MKTAEVNRKIKLSGNAEKVDEKLLLNKVNKKLKNQRTEEPKNLNYFTKIGHNFQ